MRLIRRGYGEGAVHWVVTRGYGAAAAAHDHLCLTATRVSEGLSATRITGRTDRSLDATRILGRANRRLSATRAC